MIRCDMWEHKLYTSGQKQNMPGGGHMNSNRGQFWTEEAPCMLMDD